MRKVLPTRGREFQPAKCRTWAPKLGQVATDALTGSQAEAFRLLPRATGGIPALGAAAGGAC
eukprot:3675104-Lingulodinium_polyedra.AAC.1